MKRLKRIASIVLAMVMVLGMAIPVAAAGTEGNTLTIKFKRSGHVYEAYRIFKGDYDNTVSDGADGTNKTLSNIDWDTSSVDITGRNKVNAKGELAKDGEDCTEKTLLEAIRANETIGTDFANCTTADDVAKVLSTYSSTTEESVSAKANAFAKVVSQYLLTATKSSTQVETTDSTSENEKYLMEGENYVYKISGLPDGYYFVKDSDGEVGASDDSYTKFLLQLLGDEVVNAKAVVPAHTKTISGGDVTNDLDKDPATVGDVHYNNEAIGDDVPFKITTSVPDMREYDRYQFALEDIMDKGLTFKEDTVVIKVGDKQLDKGTLVEGNVQEGDYAVVVDLNYTISDGKTGTKVEIIFGNFIQYKEQAGAIITITYSATLNEDATIGPEGNRNTSSLKYSINPNHVGEKDNFEESDPKGTTPESWTKTFVTAVKLSKISAENRGALTGAQFTIEGTRLNQMVVTGYEFVENNTSGTYWKLNDGSFTTDNPATPGMDTSKYESTDTKYEKKQITTVKNSSENGTTKISETLEVNDEGVLTFKGLAAGTYEITEVKSPAGYNLLSEPIYLEVEMTAIPETSYPATTTCTWTIYQKDKDGNYLKKDASTGAITTTTNKEEGITLEPEGDTNVFKIDVENSAGSMLPSTGGIGTTIFYVVGGILVLGAGVLLVAKKRMSNR